MQAILAVMTVMIMAWTKVRSVRMERRWKSPVIIIRREVDKFWMCGMREREVKEWISSFYDKQLGEFSKREHTGRGVSLGDE